MKTEKIAYAAHGLSCEGVLAYEDTKAASAPLLLMAPNWLGITPAAIEVAQDFARRGYVVFLADMYGAGKGPKGDEVPMEFLAPLLSQPEETRARINLAFETMTAAAKARGIGDASRRAAIGYCFGGANVIDLARSGADVAAVVSMHGSLQTSLPAQPGQVKAAVLAIHGADDPIAPKKERDQLEEEMRQAGARWAIFCVGNVYHSFTDPQANQPPFVAYSESTTRYGYALAQMFIADAFAGKI